MVSRFVLGAEVHRAPPPPPAAPSGAPGGAGPGGRPGGRWPGPPGPAGHRQEEAGGWNPLSPQSKSQGPAVWARSSGVTSYPWSQGRMDAPRPLRHRTVASMSWEVWGQTTRTGRSPKAAQISSRWAADLEGMAANVPWAGPWEKGDGHCPSPLSIQVSSWPTGIGWSTHLPPGGGTTRERCPPARFLSERVFS